MAECGSSDYRSSTASSVSRQVQEAVDAAPQKMEEIAARVGTLADEFGTAVKERPLTTIAIAVGVAFAIGALWKMGQARNSRSSLQSFYHRLPELPSRQALLRGWR